MRLKTTLILVLLSLVYLPTANAEVMHADHDILLAQQAGDYLMVSVQDDGEKLENRGQDTWFLYEDGQQIWSGNVDFSNCLLNPLDTCTTDASWMANDNNGKDWALLSTNSEGVSQLTHVNADTGLKSKVALPGLIEAQVEYEGIVAVLSYTDAYRVHAYDYSGNELWNRSVVGDFYSEMVQHGNRLAVTTDGGLAIMTFDGENLVANTRVVQHISLSDDAWATTRGSGLVERFDYDGNLSFSRRPQNSGYGDLLEHDNTFYTITTSGRVYAFTEDDYQYTEKELPNGNYLEGGDYWYLVGESTWNQVSKDLLQITWVKEHRGNFHMQGLDYVSWDADIAEPGQLQVNKLNLEMLSELTSEINYDARLSNLGDFPAYINASLTHEDFNLETSNLPDIALPGETYAFEFNIHNDNVLAGDYEISLVLNPENVKDLLVMVAEAPDLKFEVSLDEIQVNSPLRTYNYYFYLENNGNAPEASDLMVEFNQHQDEWNAEISPSQVELQPGERELIHLELTTPRAEYLENTHLTIKGDGIGNELKIKLITDADLNGHLEADADALTARPGQSSVAFQVTVQNNGNVPYAFNLELDGNGKLGNSLIHLQPGAKFIVPVTAEGLELLEERTLIVKLLSDDGATLDQLELTAKGPITEEDKDAPGFSLIALMAALGAVLALIRRRE